VALFILVGLFVVGLLLALSTTFPQVSTGYQFSMAVQVLAKPAVLIGIVALFCYISLESSMSTWSKPYVTEMLGGANDPTAVQRAGFALSLFGVAMMVGRFATSAIKNLTAIGVRLIAGAAVVATLAIITMITTSSGSVAVACVALAGLVFAPIFPTIIGVTFAKFDPSLYGSIFGIMFSIGLLGATFVPKIIGDLSTGGSVQASLKIVAAIAAVLVVISLFLNVGAKPKETVGARARG
jgi:fucose permease